MQIPLKGQGKPLKQEKLTIILTKCTGDEQTGDGEANLEATISPV